VIRYAASALAAVALSACGVKAPPRPPERAGHPARPVGLPAAPAQEPPSCDGACGEPSTATTTSAITSTSTATNG
jgi:hypothetical protein